MRSFLLSLLVVLSFSITAQTENIGNPKTWSSKYKLSTKSVSFPSVDVVEQLRIDSLNSTITGSKELRFGYEHPTEIDVISSGTPFYTPKGDKITTLEIECPEALSINVIFDEFELAEGSSLFIYDQQKTAYIGAYTSKNNNPEKVLGTELIEGDNVIIELFEPKEVIGKSKLVLGTVVHGYRSIAQLVSNTGIMKNLNSSGNCNYDVNCPEGAGWELQRNSVGLIVAGGGICTGALVYNTSGVVIPYFLTARHCGTNNVGSWVFRFRWEAPSNGVSCATSANSTNGPTNMTVNGSVLRASNSNSDFTLVELNSEPDPQWGIYYNGWENDDAPTNTSTTGIHHPSGDIKKISFSNMAPNKTPLNFNGNPNAQMWEVPSWSLGTTEQGSSGSPLFNQNKRVIGVLSGGSAACSGTINNGQNDYYGRFGVAWDESAAESAQLKHWLDPNNTGNTVINGFDPGAPIFQVDAAILSVGGLDDVVCGSAIAPQVVLLNNGTLPLTSATITYELNGTNNTYNWTGSLATSETSTITLPNLAIGSGENTLTVSVQNPNNSTDENAANNTKDLSFLGGGQGENLTLDFNFDCYASETSWRIVDSENTTWYVGEGYTDAGNSSQNINENICLTQGCYSIIVEDSYGDGLQGSQYSQCSFDGNMTLTRGFNNEVVAEIDATNVDFESQISFDFCVDNITSVTKHDLSKHISIYPNPASNMVTIHYDREQTGTTFEILSITGQIVYAATPLTNEHTVDVRSFKNGIYLIKVSSSMGTAVQKLVVR